MYASAGSAIRVTGALGQVIVKSNVGVGSLQGVSAGLTLGDLALDFGAANTTGKVPNDLFPKLGSKLLGAGDVTYLPSDDFNGGARAGVADVGAYKFAPDGNPGWTLAEGFKPPVTSSSLDGGVPAVGDAGIGGQRDASANTEAGSPGPSDSIPSSGCGCRTMSRGNDAAGSGAYVVAIAGLITAARKRRRS